jgi:hypothetical protein
MSKANREFDEDDTRSFCPECNWFDCPKIHRCPYYYETNPNHPNYEEEK